MGRFLNRAIAVLFVMLFIVIASLSTCTVAFRESLVNIDTYKQTFEQQNLYEDIIPYVVPAILKEYQSNLSEGESFSIDLNDIDEFMTVDDWRLVAEQLLPPEWLKTQTESILETLELIIAGDFSQRENVIDLTEILNRLQGDTAERASEIIIQSAPECNAQQLIQLRQFSSQSGQIFPVCHPPAALNAKATNVIEVWFNNLGRVISLGLEQQSDALTIPENVARLVYNLFQLDSQLSWLFFLCPLSLIGFIIIFAVRTRKSFGRWIGWSLLLAGIITLILIFTSQVPVFATFDDVVRANSDIERFEAQIYAGFVRSVYVDASASMLFFAGLMIGLGFILIAISVIGRSRNYLVPEGSVLVTEDGRVISTATRQNVKTIVMDKDN